MTVINHDLETWDGSENLDLETWFDDGAPTLSIDPPAGIAITGHMGLSAAITFTGGGGGPLPLNPLGTLPLRGHIGLSATVGFGPIVINATPLLPVAMVGHMGLSGELIFWTPPTPRFDSQISASYHYDGSWAFIDVAMES